MTRQATMLGAAPTVGLDGLLRSMADDEFVIGFTDSEWTGVAPLLEEDVAMSSISQDELGHAAELYRLLGTLTGDDADAIAYDREPAEYRHARLLDHGRGDWALTMARRYLYETADAVRIEALIGGSWAPLADLVGKIAREERYHLMHVEAWLDRLAGGGTTTRARLVAALQQLGPDAGTVFTPLTAEPSLVADGVLAAPMGQLEDRWRTAVGVTFARLGLPPLPATRDPDAGRTDHGAPFDWLWSEFTMVRHGDRGATW